MGGCHLPSGLLGTAHPCPLCAPLPGHCHPYTLLPSPCGARSGGRGPGTTEENKRLSLSSSKSIQGGKPGAISTTGRPSASPGAAQGSKELAFGFSRDVCLLLGRGPAVSAMRVQQRTEKGSLGALGWDADIRIQPPGGGSKLGERHGSHSFLQARQGPTWGTHIPYGMRPGWTRAHDSSTQLSSCPADKILHPPRPGCGCGCPFPGGEGPVWGSGASRLPRGTYFSSPSWREFPQHAQN